MLVGVPKETKPQEFRVGLTPEAVREYVEAGLKVLIEHNAGTGIGATDADYIAAGAVITPDANGLFEKASLIIKVKELTRNEWSLIREDHVLFTYLHLAPDPEQTNALLKSGCTAVAYETVTDALGGLPLLAPMSEVAGRLAIEAAAVSLRRHTGGRGVLMGGVPGVAPARVVVLGGGVVGTHAARMAVGLGAEVTIVERSLARLRTLEQIFAGRVRTRFSSVQAIEDEVTHADVVVGAVLIPGASAPKMISHRMLSSLKRGAVLVDVSIDQGGCFETSHPTTHADPTYEVEGVIHYCVANMPGAVPVTSSQALSNATLPFGLALAKGGLDALRSDPHLLSGLNLHRGQVTHRAIADSLGLEFVPPLKALAA